MSIEAALLVAFVFDGSLRVIVAWTPWNGMQDERARHSRQITRMEVKCEEFKYIVGGCRHSYF